MKTKISPAIVGLFVLGALALCLVALLSFGGLNLFAQPQRFVVYFDESIHGLDLGSPVKLRGVRVGRVVGMNIRYDTTDGDSVVSVVCELSRNILTDTEGNMLDVTDREALEQWVQDGLRARLGIIGLATGLLYVELDFLDPHEYPVPASLPEARYVVVPAARSAIAEFQASFTDILADLKEIDFATLAGELQALLVSTRQQIEGLDTARLSTEWVQAGAAVRRFAESPELAHAVANLDGALTELRTTLTHLDGQIGPTSDELRATLAQAQKTLQQFDVLSTSVRQFVAAQGNIGGDLTRALDQLGAAASAVQRLADFLERNPSSLLSGRARDE